MREGCHGILGRIIKGELVLDKVRANTSGVNVIIACPVCGTIKTWWAKDRAVVGEALNVLSKAFGKLLQATE